MQTVRQIVQSVGLVLSLAVVMPHSLQGNPECPPASSGGGEGKSSGGGGVGVGISIDLGKIGRRKVEEDPFAEAPKKATTQNKEVINKVASVIALNEYGRPVSSQPKQACCVFTALTLRNTWNHPIVVEIRNDDGVVTGRSQLGVGATHTFQGDLGECIRITVASPQMAHSLIEDVRVCCKDLGQKNFYFYGVRLVNYSSRKCTKEGGDDPRDKDQPTEEGRSKPKPGEDPRDVATDTPPPPNPQGGIRIPTPTGGGQPHHGGETQAGTPQPGTGTTTRGPGTGGTGTTTRNPPPTGPTGQPNDDPRDRDEEKVGLLFTRMQDEWLPQDGNVTSVQVQIFRKDRASGKWRYPGPARVITVQFAQRSAEKGVCLNWGKQTTPDLAFLPRMNSGWNCTSRPGSNGDFPDMAVTKEAVQMALLNINSYDYGSFSSLKAFAPGCVHLRQSRIGTVTEITEEQAILAVPKDDNNNQISDCWIEDWLSPVSNVDRDANPINSFNGDGLSAYEEYRGFMVKGSHLRTSVDDKDLFLSNPGNFPTSKFKSFSNLQVHEVGDGEWQKSNGIINYNLGNAALTQPQHLIKIGSGDAAVAYPGLLGRCVHKGDKRFGPPKNVDVVWIFMANHYLWIPGAPESARMLDADQLSTTVAHETGHGLGAAHHGEGFAMDVWLQPLGGTTPSPDPLLPERFHDAPDLLGISLPRPWKVAPRHCTYSGAWNCVMRYRVPYSTIFYKNGAYHDMMLADDTEPFSEFCGVQYGTRDNDHDGLAGDCAPGRGDCSGALRVSDFYENNPP